MLLSTLTGSRSAVFSKDSFDSLLTSTHLTDLMIKKNGFGNISNKKSKLKEECELEHKQKFDSEVDLHFLVAANDSPMTPAPA